jgi:preprotein translocase subunit SecG
VITLLQIIWLLLALGLIATVALQSDKAAGLGSVAGGSQAWFGKKKGMDEMLAKWTTYMVPAWMVITLLLSILARRQG